MKKNVDAMTAISILLIVINLVVLWVTTVSGDSCGGEFEVVSQTSLLNFGQLFGGTAYAMAIQPTVMSLNGVIRNSIRYCTNDKLFMVSNIDNISTNRRC